MVSEANGRGEDTANTHSNTHWRSRAAWIVACSISLGGGYALGQRAARSDGEASSIQAQAFVSGKPESLRSLHEVLRDGDAGMRAEWLARELPRMGPEALPDIEVAIRSFDLNLGAVEYVLLTRALSRHDPEQAYKWALYNAPNSYRDGALMAAIDGWARRDPLATVEALGALPPGEIKDLGLTSLVGGWYASGQPDLEQYIVDLGHGFARQRAMAAYVRALISDQGSDAAMAWAEGLSDDDARLKQTAFIQVALRLGIADPRKAVEWEDRHGDGPYGEVILQRAAGRWVLVDPPAAMKWLSESAPGERRDKAVKYVLQRWRQSDRDGMLRWVAEIGPEGIEPWFQPALGLYAMAVLRRDPLEAIKWAGAIESEADRNSTYVAIALKWRRLDPAAAEAWVAQSELSEEQKANARMDLKPRRKQRREVR